MQLLLRTFTHITVEINRLKLLMVYKSAGNNSIQPVIIASESWPASVAQWLSYPQDYKTLGSHHGTGSKSEPIFMPLHPLLA